MEIINELELRRLLKKRLSGSRFTSALVRKIIDESLAWEEKRSFWHYLFLSGRSGLLAHALVQALKVKQRIPFDLFIQICSDRGIRPSNAVVQALLKGIRKRGALDELIGPRGWDAYDERISQAREQLLHRKASEKRKFKDGLLEKFQFLKSQRMTEQAGRVLRRMVELYPEDSQFKKLKADFEEQWARDVLATHVATLGAERWDRTKTAPSSADQEMLDCFQKEGERLCVEHREFAVDLAVAFWFMEEYSRALEALAWGPPGRATDWMRVELLLQARRFIECIELLGMIEVRYIEDPETTFAVSYVRAQCLHSCGQHAAAIEILQSIVRVRPNYRSAGALVLEWTEGAAWD